MLTNLKKENLWLLDVDSTALTSANDALADAFSNFFEKRAGFPKFHKRKNFASYTSKKKSNNIAIGDKFIKLPKLGNVKAKLHRLPKEDWVMTLLTGHQNLGKQCIV